VACEYTYGFFKGLEAELEGLCGGGAAVAHPFGGEAELVDAAEYIFLKIKLMRGVTDAGEEAAEGDLLLLGGFEKEALHEGGQCLYLYAEGGVGVGDFGEFAAEEGCEQGGHQVVVVIWSFVVAG
jgi:hypothetical protein